MTPELLALLDVPIDFWMCPVDHPQGQRVVWDGDDPRCLHCGRARERRGWALHDMRIGNTRIEVRTRVHARSPTWPNPAENLRASLRVYVDAPDNRSCKLTIHPRDLDDVLQVAVGEALRLQPWCPRRKRIHLPGLGCDCPRRKPL